MTESIHLRKLPSWTHSVSKAITGSSTYTTYNPLSLSFQTFICVWNYLKQEITQSSIKFTAHILALFPFPTV
jgi:hypothetical protein